MAENSNSSLPRKLFVGLVLVLGGIIYGFFATTNQWFVAGQINLIRLAFVQVYEEFQRPWYLSIEPPENARTETIEPDAVAPGLIMVAGVNEDDMNFVRVIDREGEIVQSWQPDWFKIWGDENVEFPAGRTPKNQPGSMLHGVRILDNGDVLLNFELLSTMRLSPCGDVIWKLDNLGHHSVDIAPDGTIWVSSEVYIASGETGYDNYVAPVNSWAIQNISMDGEIIQTIEVLDILRRNNLLGLMYLSSLDNAGTVVGGDTLHLNEVEVFPAGLESDVFEPGDLMISLRNINTIIVVDPVDFKVKFQSTGQVLRQHDPDFAANNKITVFDNRNLDPLSPPESLYSQIVELDALGGAPRVRFKGEGDAAFYSQTMGKHQILDNGNIMIASAREGRAFEVAPDGRLLWQYYNLVDSGFAGLLPEANVLPQFMDKAFFERQRENCPT